MKNLIAILLVPLLTISFSSCNKDDNEIAETLKGTHWVRTTNSSIHFTFTTESEFTYVEYGGSYTGTYTYNGSTGALLFTLDLNDPINFKVNENILITEQNEEEDTIYIKQ